MEKLGRKVSSLKIVMNDAITDKHTLIGFYQLIHMWGKPPSKGFCEQFNEAVNEAYRSKIAHHASIRLLAQEKDISLVDKI